MTLVELLAQIARRDSTRSEATLQADIRQLLLTAPLSLSAENVVTADLETPVGIRRRIDIELGSCLIEVKRDLSVGSVGERRRDVSIGRTFPKWSDDLSTAPLLREPPSRRTARNARWQG